MFKQLKKQELFLQTPLLTSQTTIPANSPPSLTQITQLTASLSPTTASYKEFIEISEIAKSIILQLEITTTDDLSQLYFLWEIRLASLVFADELTIAQGEAKRLSTTFDELVPKLQSQSLSHSHSQTDKEQEQIYTKPYQYNTFPNEVPYTLRLLIIRLRSNGPGKIINEEYFTQLWGIRYIYIHHPDTQLRGITSVITKCFYYGLSSSLIAKKEYFTYLTNAETLIKSLELSGTGNGSDIDGEGEEEEKKFKNRVLFLNSLINIIIGESDIASFQFDQIDKDELSTILNHLETILNSINPVLDPKRRDSTTTSQDEEDRQKINLHSETVTIDTLFDLYKRQLITGRIICSLCATFELELRGDDSVLRSNVSNNSDDNNEIHQWFLNLWKQKPYKLYTFE